MPRRTQPGATFSLRAVGRLGDSIVAAVDHTVLIVGLGSIGQRHARNLARLGTKQLLAVRSGHGTRPIPADLPIETFGCYEDALARRPDIGIVCTPTSLHVGAADTMIAAGLDVLVEKPISHSIEGVDHLIERASDSSRLLGVAYPLRFHPLVQTARQWLADDRLGPVRYARASVSQYPPSWMPGRDYRESYAVREALGGGCVRTFIHEIDLLYYLFGMPTSVIATTGHVSSLDTDAEDVAEIALTYRGMIGSVHIDYVQRSALRSRFLQLVGERASLWLDLHQHTLQLYEAPHRRDETRLDGFDFNTLHMNEVADFISCAETRSPVNADGRAALSGLQCAVAALESAKSGRRVDLPCA